MVIPTLTQPATGPPPALARLAAQPGDATALQLLRATFAAASAPPLEALAGAAVNLIDRIQDRSVAADSHTTALLGEAYASLGGCDEQDCLALAERLDACASGLGNVPPPAEDEPPSARPPTPPLLATLADGTTVLPGTFAPQAAVADPMLDQTGTTPPPPAAVHEVKDIAALLETACLRLTAQVGTLELLAGKDLARLANELSATSTAIDGQRQALAQWVAAHDGTGTPSA